MEELIKELKANSGFMGINEIARERVYKAIKNTYKEHKVDSYHNEQEGNKITLSFHIGDKTAFLGIEL